MAEDLKDELERLSVLLDGPVMVTLVWDATDKKQKLHIIRVERLQPQ